MTIQFWCGDVFRCLEITPSASIDCIVTSPPYFGLRNYGVAGQIGLEPTMKEYVATIVAVCAELRRVLKPGGTFWLNIGDSFFRDYPLHIRSPRGHAIDTTLLLREVSDEAPR